MHRPMSSRPDGTFLTRVRLRDYKSIAECDVTLGPLTLLVGPNGSGKSNFVDALRFVRQFVVNGLTEALRVRGGFLEVVSRRPRGTESFRIDLELTLPDGRAGRYALEIVYLDDGLAAVRTEEAQVGPAVRSRVDELGILAARGDPTSRFTSLMSWGEPFAAVRDGLAAMSFSNPIPALMRDPEPNDLTPEIQADGSNIANVLEWLRARSPNRFERVQQYMQALLPDLDWLNVVPLGAATPGGPTTELPQWRTVQFAQRVRGSRTPIAFYAKGMSDGTLRALAIVTALLKDVDGARPTLVGIEEPENSLHPGAVDVILDAMREASRSMQVIATTHSADMLDEKHLEPEQLLVVDAASGAARVAPLEDLDRDSMRRRMFSAGDLLRMGRLRLEDEDGQSAGLVAEKP